ncbi:MAG: lysophospholipid acyltransferase family protein [Hyphomicrobiales bacterium]
MKHLTSMIEISVGGILILSGLVLLLIIFRRPLIEKVWKYRKEIIRHNLSTSFPELGPKDINNLIKEYYKHMCDLVVEPFFLLSKKRAEKMQFNNTEILDDLLQKKKDIVLFSSHYGNWENMAALPLFTGYEVVAAYTPVKNQFINNLLGKLRKRYNVTIVPKNDFYKVALRNKNSDRPKLYIMIGDQSPSKDSIKNGIPFLNHNTPVQIGPVRLSQKLDCPIVYLDVNKTKRYQYEYSFKLIEEEVKEYNEMELIKKCYIELENTIRRSPGIWLWSHKRWKYEHLLKAS